MILVWTVIWFIVNMMFVASAIVFLFMHRAVTEAKGQGVEAGRLSVLMRRRKVLAVVSILLFVAMSASFMANMMING
ncbi:hypothetical protein ACFQZE_02070 [Paenibacillus sp. GCM10027627]|uniref:hypothetical protein n=1 Tax=unclassified Paenibacillus TaxID=185978 RepID=UPI003627BFB5